VEEFGTNAATVEIAAGHLLDMLFRGFGIDLGGNRLAGK
jgi:hypothetical protein